MQYSRFLCRCRAAAPLTPRPQTPILPYVGTFLRDVVFACDGNPDFIDLADGVKVMNFDRLHMVGSQVRFRGHSTISRRIGWR